jgi:DNA polymerase III subunit beta
MWVTRGYNGYELNNTFMKITTTQRDLDFALDVVSKAITPNSTLPVLNNILLKAAGKKLFLSATNLETAIKYSIDTDVKNEGSITVPAKLITSYVNLLEDDKVDLSIEDGNVLSINSKNSHTKIKGISADEFPVIPEVQKESTFKISAKDLSCAIDGTVFAAAMTTTRPVLSGVYLHIEKDELTMVATDSYRLAETKVKLDTKVDGSFQCIIPVKTLSELGRILGSKYEEDEVEVQISKNQILFTTGTLELTSRLIEGKFPDYKKIIPREHKTTLDVDVKKLSNATKRVSLFAKENNNNVKLTVTNDGKMNIYTDETRVGEERAEVDVMVVGENNNVALNSQFLLDVLNNLEESVTIEMNEKLTPIVVKPKKNKGYLYIIMPLKV